MRSLSRGKVSEKRNSSEEGAEARRVRAHTTRSVLKACGISGHELARRSGLGPRTCQLFLYDGSTPHTKTLDKIETVTSAIIVQVVRLGTTYVMGERT